jgi:integrase
MARTAKNPKLNTRTARLSLASRREPYWQVLSAGCAIGYRKGVSGGSWIARFRDDTGKQNYLSLGAADDILDPDEATVFSFSAAQERARNFFALKVRGSDAAAGPYTVSAALEDYFKARELRGSKGVKADRYAADARILPELGALQISKLSTKRIRDWHFAIAAAPKLVRTKRFADRRATQAVDKSDEDAIRARRATANRLLTILKAALNHAFHEGRVHADEVWRKVKPFREVDTAIVRHLTSAECIRLINASGLDLRHLIRGALLTGCRYGELTRMVVRDFDSSAGTVTVRQSKAGKPRHVALNDEGRELFLQLTAGKAAMAIIFQREDGKAWAASHQQRPLKEAATAANIQPAPTFHILRHTYASLLAMAGAPMGVIAAQLGHSDTRMTEKHYAHLAPSYIASTVRAALPSLGIVQPTNVTPLDEIRLGK